MAKSAPLKILELEQRLLEVARQYYHLLLLVGPVHSGKTLTLKELCRLHEIPYLNLNLELSRRLLGLTARERPLRAARLLTEIVNGEVGDLLALDNIELLFEPSLQQDPLACLCNLSRRKTLIAAWGGRYVDDVLTYAAPGHAEYRRYQRPEALIVTMS